MPKYAYSGPRVRVVELDRDVEDGEVVEGSDALACAAGFSEVGGSSSPRKPAPVASSGDPQRDDYDVQADDE